MVDLLSGCRYVPLDRATGLARDAGRTGRSGRGNGLCRLAHVFGVTGAPQSLAALSGLLLELVIGIKTSMWEDLVTEGITVPDHLRADIVAVETHVPEKPTVLVLVLGGVLLQRDGLRVYEPCHLLGCLNAEALHGLAGVYRLRCVDADDADFRGGRTDLNVQRVSVHNLHHTAFLRRDRCTGDG